MAVVENDSHDHQLLSPALSLLQGTDLLTMLFLPPCFVHCLVKSNSSSLTVANVVSFHDVFNHHL